MTKVHPNVGAQELSGEFNRQPATAETSLTVWRKSLLFNCNGFTVFDCKGNLVFRVDNYSSTCAREVVLMDAAGKPLLTIRRKRLSMSDEWLVYNGEETCKPWLSMKKQMNILQSKSVLVYATRVGGVGGYSVEGSYSQRSCMVYDERRQLVAEIRRKEAVGGVGFGGDVFRLVVQPGLESAVAMAVVVLLEQMFGSKGSFSLIR
ncbi:protein LURP-one-related 8-like [Dioscorea cayenensis subsp. rotundata]|uniref:Protein LURP-one-related 8-like n=1 Tax=Dioscorea cayennensis subsp. rotundata TaxID=55577 RepID=A0AB40AIC9_DIOCR|nr:protein LURP-one-related 8-like [Dioscorea cayenensis subsp. rotundata]